MHLSENSCKEQVNRIFFGGIRKKFREDFRRGLNIAATESTSEEAIGESAGCSKIHELSDRVRLSGVCSVKLALAHRIASDGTTAATTVPREVLFWSIARTNRISGFILQRWQIRPSSFPRRSRVRELRVARTSCLSFMPTLHQAEVTQVAN